jgi:hypothetical protein
MYYSHNRDVNLFDQEHLKEEKECVRIRNNRITKFWNLRYYAYMYTIYIR